MTIWLDVTTMWGQNPPAPGIVRVEAETARQFLAANDSNFQFCRFVRSAGRYLAVTGDEVRLSLACLDSGGHSPPSEKPEPDDARMPAPTSTESRDQRLKRRLIALVARLPPRYRDAAHRLAQSRRGAFGAFVRAYREARLGPALMWRGSESVMELEPATTQPMTTLQPDSEPPFAAGDVYVSLGLDWDQKYPVYLYELKRRLRLKVVLFFDDILAARLPHLCVAEVAHRFPGYLVDAAWCADKILCISNSTRRDVGQFLESVGAPVPRLDVVPPGCDIVTASETSPSQTVAELLSRRFILFVSTTERRKNHETLCRAYARLIEGGRHDLPLLVFVVVPGAGIGELMADLRMDPRIQPYARVLSQVSDGDLRRLYEKACFTVSPSLYEGWGLEIAQSLAYGKFCLASNAASIPEVGMDLVDYLDPWDVPAWAEKLAWYFDHPDDVAKREVEIRSHYRPTTWQQTGKAVVSAASALAGA